MNSSTPGDYNPQFGVFRISDSFLKGGGYGMPASRHSKGIGTLFLDGHVELYRVQNINNPFEDMYFHPYVGYANI